MRNFGFRICSSHKIQRASDECNGCTFCWTATTTTKTTATKNRQGISRGKNGARCQSRIESSRVESTLRCLNWMLHQLERWTENVNSDELLAKTAWLEFLPSTRRITWINISPGSGSVDSGWIEFGVRMANTFAAENRRKNEIGATHTVTWRELGA